MQAPASTTFFDRLITGRAGRITAASVAALLVAVSLVAGAFGVDSAKADSLLSLAATETSSILAGENSTVTLTATNSSTTNLYNIAFEYTLPPGATYVPGTTTPTLAGDPQIVVQTVSTTPLVTQQVLIWNNVEDLPAGDIESLGFEVDASAATFPVGSDVTGTGAVYANTDARTLVTFTGATASTFTDTDTASPTQTAVTALSVTKTEPSPETELMRGVHDHPTTYTIVVKNTTVAPTDTVSVTDYLPAGLEFLGCGGTDNSSALEYPTAASLTATPAPTGGCTQPTSVDTVTNPVKVVNGVSTTLTGVYTVVTWTLGDFAAGATQTLNYEAGIPLHENTMTFPAGTPTPASLNQASNLDNNTGPLTRQDNAGSAYTNDAVAAGSYTGPLAPGASADVAAEGDHTVKSMDLSVVKSVTPTVFTTGSTATYSLLVRTSEYENVAGVELTDVIPNGLCPELPAGTPTIGTIPSDCLGTGSVTNATVVSEQANSDGSFTVIFIPTVSTAKDANFTITYPALMRATYDGSINAPTAAGDSFTNNVSITGTSTDTLAIDPTQTQPSNTVTDDSHATITSSAPSIDKEVLPRTDVSGGASDCAAHASQYVEDSSATAPVFQLGDYVCFKLTVVFSSSTQTKNAQVSDFVPTQTSFNDWVYGTESTVPAGQVAFSDPTSGLPTWKLGATEGSGTDTFVAKGSTLVLYVSTLVTSASPTAGVDLTGNLMKYRQVNTDGTVLALRDQAGFAVAPAGAMTLAKGVTAVNGTAVSGAPAANAAADETNTVDFSLTATNSGTAAAGNNFETDSVKVWDYLPSPLTCASVTSPIPDAGTCTDDFAGTTSSALVWTIAGPIAPGASASPLTYQVTLPRGLSVSQVLTNNASIVSFTSPNTAGGNTLYYPTNSLDTTDSALWNTTAANATASVTLPNAAVLKTVVGTSITDTNNNEPNQVVAGETVDYDFSVTIPANTSAFSGVLSDTLPVTLGAPASVTADVPGFTGLTPSTAGAAGYTLATSGATTTLTLPTTVDNTTASPEVFTVHLLAVRVLSLNSSGSPINVTAGAAITNTATFDSDASVGGTPLTPQRDSAAVTVVVPHPTLVKSATGTTNAGDIVTYTLTANDSTPAGGSAPPPAYDTIIADCLPSGLTFQAYGTLPGTVTASPPVAGNASNGCAVGTTLLSWTVGTLAPNTPLALTYTAQIDPAAAGLATYTNTALLTTSTISDNQRVNTDEGVLTATASKTTTVSGATITKSVAKPNLTIGESSQFTITASLPANVNFYQASVIDTVPTGLATGTATITCQTVQTTPVDCSHDFGAGVGGTPLATSGNKVGWYLGDIAAATYPRTVTVVYTGTVQDVSTNVATTALKNSAVVSWNTTDSGQPPADAGATFGKSSTVPGTATVTVDEPSLTIGKTVSNPIPSPGDSFTYTLSVTNAATATTSAAFNVTVTDVVPTGVVVQTINNGGSISGADATTGGGTITWTLPGSIAVNATDQLTYTAKLAPSSTLTAAALVNTASVPTYSSLATGGRTYTSAPPTATATVTPQFPNVTVQKAATGGANAYVNKAYEWTVTYTNNGPGVASTITPTDVLPANWLYQPGSASIVVAGGASQQVEPTTSISSGVETLVWPAFGPVPSGSTVVITYNAIPQSAATTTPGVGSTHPHVNSASGVTTDTSGATGNSSGSYTGAAAQAQTLIGTADVSITKTAGTALVAGQTSNDAWHLTVTNHGTDTAVGPFQISDTPTVPSGVTIVSASGTGWTCSQVSTSASTLGQFTCVRSNATNTLASGASFPVVNIKVAVASSTPAGTTIPNTATISDSTFDPTLSNNSSSLSLNVATSADLNITKQISIAGAAAGKTASWAVTLNNLGPSDSAGPITVTDTLPSGLTNVTVNGGTSWTCGPITTTVTCTYSGSLASAATAPVITVTGLVPSSATGNLVNSVSVTPTTTDPVTTNNSAISTAAIDDSTTIAIVKKQITSTLIPGENATYEFDVSNTGTADAQAITVVDHLPNGLTYAGSSTSISGTWTCSGTTTVTCTLTGTLSAASGSNTAAVRILVSIPSNVSGTVTNTATVSATNAPSAQDTVGGPSTGTYDLSLAKTHPTGSVFAGSSVIYTLTGSNNGPSDWTGTTTIVDTLPTGETYVSATGTGWSCSPSGQVVTCTSTAGIVDGGSAAALKLTVAIAANAGTTVLTNTATVSGPTTDTDPSNNVANDATDVTTSSAVTIAKSGDPTPTAGQNTSYTITVTNSGPSDATDVSVTDSLPAGITPVSITSTEWTCTLSSFSCGPRTDLAPGVSTITVVGLVASGIANGTTLTNSATVTSQDTAGTHSATATFQGTISTLADLVLTKSAASANVDAGAQTSFALGLSNRGSSDAVGPITITDTLPAGMSYVGATGATGTPIQWTCVQSISNAQSIVCTLDGGASIAAGATAPALNLEVSLAGTLTAQTLTNSAVAATPTTESSYANNTATAPVTVVETADLGIVKSLASTVRIGDTISFSLAVHNYGPSSAAGVSVTDVMPVGLSLVAATVTSPWTCVVQPAVTTGTPVVCDLTGTLASGADAPAIEISAMLGASTYPTFVNTASVTSTTIDRTQANNSSSLTVTVPPQVLLTVTKTHAGRLTTGQNATYSITVTNTGTTPQPAGYTITDPLPSGLSYVSWSGTGVSCAAQASVITCTFGSDLAIGATSAVGIVAHVTAPAPSTVVNTATVGTLAEQLSTAGDTASDPGTVVRATKILGYTGVLIEGNLIFALVMILLGLLFVGGAFARTRLRRRFARA